MFLRRPTVAAQKRDVLATKYCFRAVSHLIDKPTNRILGTFTGYDKTPDIGMAVEIACNVHASAKETQGIECTDAEMLLHEVCPVECGGEVTFVFYTEDDDDDDAYYEGI